MTLDNNKQKINDCLGNPVEIGIVVIWRIVNTAKAVFNVDNYKEFLSIQTDSALRNIVRIYPHDVAPNVDTTDDGQADEGSLRGSSEEVAEIVIDPEAINPDDADMLQDMIVAAVNEALRKAEEASTQSMSRITGGLGSLGGLF